MRINIYVSYQDEYKVMRDSPDDALGAGTYRLEVGVAPEDCEARVTHLHRIEEVGVTGCGHLRTWPWAQERHRDVWQGAPRLANLCHLHHADLAQPVNQKR